MTVYVEGEKAARELGVRQRGGFFDDNRCRPATLDSCTRNISIVHSCMLRSLKEMCAHA